MWCCKAFSELSDKILSLPLQLSFGDSYEGGLLVALAKVVAEGRRAVR